MAGSPLVVSRKSDAQVNGPTFAQGRVGPPEQPADSTFTPEGLTWLQHYYTAEAGGLASKMPEDARAHVETLRSLGQLPPAGIENFDALSQGTWQPQPLNAIAPSGTSMTTTPTTVLGPGESPRSLRPGGELSSQAGQFIGGIAAPAAVGAGLAATGGAPLIVAVPLLFAAARAGGALGNEAQQLLEQLTGQPPAESGTPTQRMAGAADTAGKGELGGQALSLVGRGALGALRAAKSLSPTARMTAAGKVEAPAMLARGNQELGQGAAQAVAQEQGPALRSLAARESTKATPSSLLRPSGDAIGGGRPDIVEILRPIRDQAGDVETIRLFAKSPDAQRVLLDVATSPEEKRVVEWALSAGKAFGQEGRTVPADVLAAARVAAKESTGTVRNTLNAATTLLGTAVGGHAYGVGGSIGGAGAGALMARGVRALEPVIRTVLDRALNAKSTALVGQGLHGLGTLATRPVAQAGAASLRR